MGIMDAFKEEDRTQMTFSAFYRMMKEVTKGELLMNAVNCDVPEEDQEPVPEQSYDCPSL